MARSKVLISRITRLIETNGRIGEGMALVAEYSEAVGKANDRLDKVIEAMDAKQVSEAVRILQEQPPLVDEVSVLDFSQLDLLAELAKKRGWSVPARIDKNAFEKAMMLRTDAAVAEPLLKMYRKAVRLNDTRLSVQTLRQLAEVDHSQDWKANLAQAEAALRKLMHVDFTRAKEKGDRDEMARIASEYVSGEFLAAPVGKAADEIIGFLEAEDRAGKRRKVEENLGIIKSCNEGEWDRGLVERMVEEIDALAEGGAEISDADRGAVAMARERCAAERAAEARELEERRIAEERERRWRECREALFVAVEHEDVAEIRKTRAATEFEDRPPEEELLRKADMIVRRAEELRVRKLRIVVIAAVIVLGCVLAVSWKVLKEKEFDEACKKEAEKLASLEKGADAVKTLGDELRRIRESDPDVYRAAGVNDYEGRLAELIRKTADRTNEVVSLLGELEACASTGWADVGDGKKVETWIATVKTLTGDDGNNKLTPDDVNYKRRLAKAELSWQEVKSRREKEKKEKAAQLHETLVAQAASVAKSLKTSYAGPLLLKDAESCVKSIKSWRRDYGGVVPELDNAAAKAEASVAEARKSQEDYVAAVGKMNGAADAKGVLEARRELKEFYGGFREVASLAPLAFSCAEAQAVVDGAVGENSAVDGEIHGGLSDGFFAVFLEKIRGIADVPAFYSLYGIKWPAKDKTRYCAVASGKPEISQPSARMPWEVNGTIIMLRAGSYEQTGLFTTGPWESDRPLFETLATTDEIRELVELANREGVTAGKMKEHLFGRVREHLKAAGGQYVADEEVNGDIGYAGYLSSDWYPAIRRVQMLKYYLEWLGELGALPDSPGIKKWIEMVGEYAQPVTIEDIPDDLTWVCLKDRRVSRRNADCAVLLSKMAQSWQKDLDAGRKSRSAQGDIAQWRVAYAGKFSFKPGHPAYEKDANAVFPDVSPDVKKDHPLYVLGKEGDRLVLKKALVAQNGNWAVVAGMKGECRPGAPLFHVSQRGAFIDTAAEFKRLADGLSEDEAKKLAKGIQLFDTGR